jgi:putative acetyltransferase
MSLVIRAIEKNDNAVLAELIRKIFREYKIDRPGTVYTDPTTDHLFELFQIKNSFYWVAVENEIILGGCGIYPTDGLPDGCVELVKFYLSPESRGKGIGKLILQVSINTAKSLNYKKMYLESFPELSEAVSLYKKSGFRRLSQPLGNSGHFACTIWMVKEL